MTGTRLGPCPMCGAAPGQPHASASCPAAAVDDDSAARELWGEVGPLLAAWFRRAHRKHAFGFQVTTNANPLPFTPGRVAALLVPAAAIWVGGDAGVTSGAGGSAGTPVAANATLSFGPEEGDSETWAITTLALAPVDVRCLELLP